MTPEQRKDELINRIRRIVTHGDDDANEDEPMVPAVYWPSRWLADAIHDAQAEQRQKDAALMCKWCRDEVPTLTLTEGSQGHAKGVLVHPEQERILGACSAQAILALEDA